MYLHNSTAPSQESRAPDPRARLSYYPVPRTRDRDKTSNTDERQQMKLGRRPKQVRGTELVLSYG